MTLHAPYDPNQYSSLCASSTSVPKTLTLPRHSMPPTTAAAAAAAAPPSGVAPSSGRIRMSMPSVARVAPARQVQGQRSKNKHWRLFQAGPGCLTVGFETCVLARLWVWVWVWCGGRCGCGCGSGRGCRFGMCVCVCV